MEGLTSHSRLPLVLKIVGLVLIVLPSLLGFGGMEFLVSMAVKGTAQLLPGSPTWDLWVDLPVPIYFKFSFFNITISEDELAQGGSLKVKELGPYVYLEDLNKVDVNVTEEDDTVEYRMTRHYYFQPDLSSGSPDDLIQIINIPFLAIAHLSNLMSDDPLTLASLDEFLSDPDNGGQKLTTFATVREILFDGYSVEAIIENLFENPIVQAAAEQMGRDISTPKSMEDGKFGLLKGKNGSDDGIWKVHRGVRNDQEFGRIVQWNSLEKLGIWKGEYCNQIKGTDGFIYPPFLTKESVIEVFSPALCRGINMHFVEEVQTRGLPCLRFEGFVHDFMNVDDIPQNECFCPFNKSSECTSGLFNLAPCLEGAPMVLSRPHFLGLPKYMIPGLAPNASKHRTLIDKHAISGATVKGAGKMQFNIELAPYEHMPSFVNVSRTLVPIGWLEEGGEMPEETRSILLTMELVLFIVSIVRWVGIALGTILIAIGFKLSMAGNENTRVESVKY